MQVDVASVPPGRWPRYNTGHNGLNSIPIGHGRNSSASRTGSLAGLLISPAGCSSGTVPRTTSAGVASTASIFLCLAMSMSRFPRRTRKSAETAVPEKRSAGRFSVVRLSSRTTAVKLLRASSPGATALRGFAGSVVCCNAMLGASISPGSLSLPFALGAEFSVTVTEFCAAALFARCFATRERVSALISSTEFLLVPILSNS